MNKERRAELAKVATKFDELKSALENLKDEELSALQGEEQDGFDNMPEGLQSSERGEKVQAAIDNLQAAIDHVDSAVSSLDDAINDINTACE